MALTKDEITAPGTYTVRFDSRQLSGKRFKDAVALVKGIDGRHEDYVYDPQNPAALRTGFVRNEDPAAAAARYDGASKTWAVTIPAAAGRALEDLRTAASAYGAVVEAGTSPAAARSTAGLSETRRASRLYGVDMAEYGCGFGPDEM